MADLAAKNRAVVVAGTESRAFADEILSVHVDDPQFSWGHVNGENGEEVLPALMISTIHPQRFKSEVPGYRLPKLRKGVADDKLILIPLRGVCKDATEVVSLIERIFRDIAAKRPLTEFSIAKEIKAGDGTAYSDAVIVRSAVWGVGVDLMALLKAWTGKRS
jgi:predicted ATP-dependent Lon-type protease